MFCKNCGAPMQPGAPYCNNCGVPAGSGMSFCPNCGKAVEANWVNCPTCGCALGYTNPGAYASDNRKSRIVAGLLGIFLGSLGVHNFYLGYTNRGIAQVLISTLGGIFTCGISTVVVEIWAIIEAVMILTGNVDVDARGIPLKD